AQTMIDNYLKTCDIMSAKSAFLILDIDKFKNFNDTFGHMFGDEILRECANKLKILFRDDDILGRLGGDEFIVMMKNVRETKTVINKVKEMLAFMTRDYRRSEANFSFTISVGVAFVSATADTYDILYKNADMALYNSKMNGRNRYSVFGDDINNIESDGITTSQYLNEFGSVDPITGGDSFASFKKKLTSLFAENPTDKFVIFYSDIKNFKAINGIYGFEKGDEVLREYSNFLAQKKTLLFARANVDNFVSVERYENENDLVKRVTSGFEGFEGISKVLENKANLRISLGAYCTDGKNDEFSIEEMIDRANLAQKQLKDENRTGFVLYKEDFRIAMINDQIIANKMENALKNKEFLPYLQPKFNINSGEIVGAEVLARWHDPIDGLIMPERFIPLFESNGFIKHMDTYMFEKTCEMLRKWIDNGKKVIPLSVNVSKIQINNSKFLDTYLSIKNKYNIPNGLIEIELTESILFDN
ncbi:MAG: diguanylate cyclase, partial [Oscillospiraceae bacterium]